MRALALIAVLFPAPAFAVGLDCTFTTVCSPRTDCQTHPGVPFRFSVLSGAFSFVTENGMVFGTPLSHVESPDIGILFEVAPGSTLLLSVSRSGEAVMTQQDIAPGGTIASVSYFGTCEPGA